MELVKSNGIKLEPTSLTITRRLNMEEGGQIADQMAAMESGIQWWVGDLLNAMESLHGEVYAQVVPDGKADTWRNYKWVSDRVKMNTRRGSLSWSHHQAVASLLSERQAIYLDRAEAEHLSVSDLKKLIAEEKGKPEKAPRMIECPECHAMFEVPVKNSISA